MWFAGCDAGNPHELCQGMDHCFCAYSEYAETIATKNTYAPLETPSPGITCGLGFLSERALLSGASVAESNGTPSGEGLATSFCGCRRWPDVRLWGGSTSHSYVHQRNYVSTSGADKWHGRYLDMIITRASDKVPLWLMRF